MNNKKKILVVAMVLSMVAILVVGGTIAYFTDTATQTNVFTAGEIDITLDEAVVIQNQNGDYLPSGANKRTEEDQTYDLHPGISVRKDPTIHLNADGLESYVAAKFIVTGADLDGEGMISTYAPYIDITKLVYGGDASQESKYVGDWNGLKEVQQNNVAYFYQDVSKASEDEWVIYMFFKKPYAGKEDIELFHEIKIPAEYDNDQMAKLDGLNIKIEAYATQIDTFSDAGKEDGQGCFEAMTTAFPEAFAF